MKRIRRSLFAICAALSLLLFAAVCVQWVRSYRCTDSISWCTNAGFRAFDTANGYFAVQVNRGEHECPTQYGPRYMRMSLYTPYHMAVAYGPHQAGDTFVSWELGDAGWYTVQNAGRMRTATGTVPLWWLFLATAALPLTWTTLWTRSHLRERRRRRIGACPACGYDLRATPDRCPECGAVALTQASGQNARYSLPKPRR